MTQPLLPAVTSPSLPELDRQVIALTRKGLSARKIKNELGLYVDVRTVQKIQQKHFGTLKRVTSWSREYHITAHFMLIIDECLRMLGKDPMFCEICEMWQARKCDVHHMKYEGATIYDLQYACRSCNTARMGQNLS